MHKKIVLFIACAILWFSLYIYIPYLTPSLLTMHISASLAGVIFSLHAFAQMFMRFPDGLVSGKSGKHKSLVIQGMVFSFAASITMYLFPNPVMIAIGNAVSGFSSATYVAYTVLYGAYYDKTQTNKAMGVIGAGSNIGILAAFLCGGSLHEAGGIKLLFLVSAIGAAIGFVNSLFVTEEQMPSSRGDAKDVIKLAENKQLMASSVLGCIAKLIVFGTAWAFTTKLAQDIGAKGVMLSLVNGLFIAASTLGSFFIATKTAKKIGETVISIAGFCILAFYCATLPLIKDIPLFLVVSFVGGLGYSSITSIFMANAVKTLPINQKSTGMGIYQSIYSIGSAIGPIIVGSIAGSAGYTAAYITAAAISIIGAVVSVIAGKQKLLQ